jgi:predicted alpha-1,6-mannanase (GH76 family)
MVLPGVCHATVAAGMAALQIFYNSATGLWNNTGWWNSANALETTIDYSRITNIPTYHSVIENTFEKQKGTKFLNRWMYDDDGWWALAWIKAYDLTGEKHYLDAAKTIFKDMTTGWDSVCGGGIWWKKNRTYKNAITNQLFFTVAIRLHQRTVNDYGKGSYIDWARHSWKWLRNSGMINRQNLFNDGLDKNCRNNGQTTWTYNQGVILGGLVDFYYSTKDPSVLKTANAIAKSAIRNLSSKGILREPCEPNCGEDGAQFKGIFIRNLSSLYQATRDPEYKRFILQNAEAIWSGSRNDQNHFGLSWGDGVDVADASRQSAAIDVLNAATLIKREPSVYQIANAVLHNLSMEASNGSEYVSGWNRNSQRVDMKVNMGCSGQYNLGLRYAAAAGDAFRFIFVNGENVIKKQVFPATEHWNDWKVVEVPNIPLKAGSNMISILFDSAKGSENWLNLGDIAIE